MTGTPRDAAAVGGRALPIPAVAHFIWYGARLPWVYRLAIRSAAIRGGFTRVVLHHEAALGESPDVGELRTTAGVELRVMDPEARLEAAPGGVALVDVYRSVSLPAARANLMRAAILHGEGGVYLDTDTVTIRSFDALREDAAFLGEERVVYPAGVRGSRDPLVRATAFVRGSVRAALRTLPGGWRGFRAIEGWYPRAVNNAVMGAVPGHPFVAGLLRAMVELPVESRTVRFALGTHLLQREVARWTGPGLVVHPPAVFYPLGPEISTHWFRIGGARVDEVVRQQTRLVHWYASVRTRELVPRIDAGYVREWADRQLFSALALPFV